MRSIQVFCGSRTGADPVYAEQARLVGATLAKKGVQIVYGAGSVGLMGVLADAALEAGGKVIGVIPFFLRRKEVCHEELSELHVVDTMQERKEKMAMLSDATLVLPGGYGTMDELFEMLTLIQLSQLSQPVGILNINDYYTPLLRQLDHMHAEGFLRPQHRALLLSHPDFPALLEAMETFEEGPEVGKWENG